MPAPRVLIVLPDQWPRALLRASLRERGYDAVGATDLSEAQLYSANEPGRGPVSLLIVDDRVLDGAEPHSLDRLREQHGAPGVLLLAQRNSHPPAGRWSHILYRPLRIGDVLDAVATLLPASVLDPPP